MDVSIIIVNYNTIALLVEAIESIFKKSKGFNFEIIVVDNNSTDSSKQILFEKYGNSVIYVALPENVGFGRANNEGLRIAKGRNILFLNPDIELQNNAIKILSDYLDEHSDVGVVGGNLFSEEGNPTLSFSRILPSIWSEFDEFWLKGMFLRVLYGRNLTFNYLRRPLKVGYVCGADMMVPMKVLKEVGFFDPEFFMYFEETELSYRISHKRYKIMNIPDAKITHLEGKSFKIKEEKIYQFIKGRFIYYKKTSNYFCRTIANFQYWLNLYLRYLIWSVFDKQKKHIMEIYLQIYLQIKRELGI